MMAARFSVLLAILFLFFGSTLAQNYNQYSLQPAVDALHRRQAQLWLGAGDKHRRTYNAEQDHQQKLDEIYAQMWANYGNPGEPDVEEEYGEHKRSNMPNEREIMLDRINQERQRLQDNESQRFAEYVNNIEEKRQRLFQTVQQQENDMQEELYGNSAGNTANYYQLRKTESVPVAKENRAAEKRRLVMPWLPVRKRSFPMSKRSPVFPKVDASISGTDEKVAHDLQRIFSAPVVADRMKTKRSSGIVHTDPTSTTTTSTVKPPPVEDKNIDSNAQLQRDQDDNHDLDHDGYLGEHDHGHRRTHDHGHIHDHEHEHDHEHHENPEHDHEHEDEHEDDEGEDHAHEHDEEEDHDSGEDNSDEQDERKKKRAIINMAKRGNQEVLKEDQIIPGDLTDFKRKKSVEWSKYIGIDRRKKSTDWENSDKPKTLEDYTPTHFRNHDQVVGRTKQDVNEKKLDNMDQELKTIEELIIDETIKFTGEHEGMTNADDIQKLRDHVISRLATAYSLEKMRRALEKLKQSVDLERHLNQNEVEVLRNVAADIEEDDDDTLDKYKRVAIKKEKVEYDNNQHTIDAVTDNLLNANSLKTNNHDDNYNFAEDSTHRTPEKKSNFMPMMTVQHDNHHRIVPSAAERNSKRPSFDLQQYSPIEEYANNAVDDECPVLDAIEKRCRAINLISGDVHQQFVMQCGVHQLCYLCGTSQSACDYQYIAETTAICGDNMECLASAQSALIIMRETPGQHIGPRECERYSCLKRALIEIGAL